MKSTNRNDITDAFDWKPRHKSLVSSGYYQLDLSDDYKIVVEPNPRGGVYAAVYRGHELIADKLPKVPRVKRRPR